MRAHNNVGFEGAKEDRREFGPDVNASDIDEKDLYSTTYEWLETFAEFVEVQVGSR